MKRKIIISLLSFIVHCSFGQLYLQPSVGYAFSSHPFESQSILIVENQETVYETKLKFVEGMHLALSFGSYIKENFFIELTTEKSLYTKHNVSTGQPDLQSLNNFFLSGYFGEIDYQSSSFGITPLIGYQIQKNKYCTYFKLGPNFMKSTIKETLRFVDWRLLDNWEFYPQNKVTKTEYTGKFHVGLQANIGICYAVKQNMQLVLDFVTVYNNYKVHKGEIKYYEIDGVSQLDQLTDTNIKIADGNDKINHSRYGFDIGIKYLLHKKE